MATKYWTTKRFNAAQTDYSKLYTCVSKLADSNAGYPSELIKPAYILVGDWTTEDFEALGNAVVLDTAAAGMNFRSYYCNKEDAGNNTPVYIVLSAQTVLDMPTGRSAGSYRYLRWGYSTDKSATSATIIKNFKVCVDTCRGCENVCNRVSDSCSPGDRNCPATNIFSRASADLKFCEPAKEFYVPLNYCTDYVPFSVRNICNLANPADVNLISPKKRGQDPEVAKLGWTRKYFGNTVCSKCIFALDKKRSAKPSVMCLSTYNRPANGTCGGPYTCNDIPKVNEAVFKRHTDYLGMCVGIKDFKRVEAEACAHSDRPLKRLNGSTMFKVYEYDDVCNIYTLMTVDPTPATLGARWCVSSTKMPMLFEHTYEPEFDMHTATSRLFYAMLQSNRRIPMRSYGWGHSSSYIHYGYSIDSDGLKLLYRRRGHATSVHLPHDDLEQLLDNVPSIISDVFGGNSKRDRTQISGRLYNRLEERKVKEVDQLASRLVSTAAKGRSTAGIIKEILATS